jgi:acetyltransferase-like isoleucine patch superfamily enzyme
VNRRRDARIVRQWLGEDARRALQQLLVARVGGSWFTPRIVRHGAYRAAGMKTLGPNTFPDLTILGPASHVTVGRHSLIGAQCYFDAAGEIRIGDNCLIGPRVMLLTSDHPTGPDGLPEMLPVGQPITIGDRVWIGAATLVLPGVTIGEGCVLAAGAVITSDCAPRGVYAGIPARRVKDLIDPNEAAA